MTAPARIRQDCLKSSEHLGTKCECCSEAINSVRPARVTVHSVHPDILQGAMQTQHFWSALNEH